MEITGRVVKHAQVRTTKNQKELVAFTIVDNQRYKTKGGEKKEIATFFNCDYWVSTKIAPHLKKGTVVTLSGTVGINSYKKADGDFIANLTFHTSNIKIIAAGKGSTTPTTSTANSGTGTNDDLPF